MRVPYLFGAGDEARTRYLHLGKVVLSVIIASAALPCGIGLGYSVDLRKKGTAQIAIYSVYLLLSCGDICLHCYDIYENE